MSNHYLTPSLLNNYTFHNRERQFHHTSFEDELAPYHYMINGDRDALMLYTNKVFGEGTGKVSSDPLRNAQYLFVSIATLSCRFCIEAGLDPTVAFNASDLYIQKADLSKTISDVKAVAKDMMLYYCDLMSEQRRRASTALPVTRAMNYVDAHLHEKIRLTNAAEYAGISANYLSNLFFQETGKHFRDYVFEQKVTAAKNMLRFTNMSITEISEYLGFANQSHFLREFKKQESSTPGEYRKTHSSGEFIRN